MSAASTERKLERLLRTLVEAPEARLRRRGETHCLDAGRGDGRRIEAALVRRALAEGLLEEDGGGLRPSAAAPAWLRRRNAGEAGFLAQHATLGAVPDPDDPLSGRRLLADLDESPVGQLARRRGRDGSPFLDAASVAAAERLRADFERGQLQPRVTANWSASINRGRRSGDAGGMADLTDSALAARRRVEAAIRAVGPELSGVLVDVCCFLKGLETVERERGWPARSAKLALRLALAALARHYGLGTAAQGPASAGLRHWGSDDYRPKIG